MMTVDHLSAEVSINVLPTILMPTLVYVLIELLFC